MRSGDRPSGEQIARHLESVFAALPATVETIYARADSGFYCGEAVAAYQAKGCRFILSARKTSRLVDELKAARWTRSPRTDADGQCEFPYQPEGWGQAHRFIALRYQKKRKLDEGQPEQYQLFDTQEYTYRVFATDLDGPIDALTWFYNQRAGAENLIKEANNDAGLTAHPSVGHELYPFSGGDAGLQPELLADAVPPRGGSHGGDLTAQSVGDGPLAVLIRSGQDLAACRKGGSEL